MIIASFEYCVEKMNFFLTVFYWELDQVSEVKGDDVVCVIKNSATLAGSLFTLHGSQIHINLPTLSDEDKEVGEPSDLCIVIIPKDYSFLITGYINFVYCISNYRLYQVGECKTKLISFHYHILDMLKMFDRYDIPLH